MANSTVVHFVDADDVALAQMGSLSLRRYRECCENCNMQLLFSPLSGRFWASLRRWSVCRSSRMSWSSNESPSRSRKLKDEQGY